uniref:Uncharacterized protein n=1 Tax=Arion vulgaris TaxID=1028688 RepID=A0A0B7AH45_9EUPU
MSLAGLVNACKNDWLAYLAVAMATYYKAKSVELNQFSSLMLHRCAPQSPLAHCHFQDLVYLKTQSLMFFESHPSYPHHLACEWHYSRNLLWIWHQP